MVTRTVRMSSFFFKSEGRRGKVIPRNRMWGGGGEGIVEFRFPMQEDSVNAVTDSLQGI